MFMFVEIFQSLGYSIIPDVNKGLDWWKASGWEMCICLTVYIDQICLSEISDENRAQINTVVSSQPPPVGVKHVERHRALYWRPRSHRRVGAGLHLQPLHPVRPPRHQGHQVQPHHGPHHLPHHLQPGLHRPGPAPDSRQYASVSVHFMRIRILRH